MQTLLNAAQLVLGLAVLAMIFLLARRLRRLRGSDPTSGFRDPCR